MKIFHYSPFDLVGMFLFFQIRDDWKYIASVIDRLQLFIFFAVTAIGTLKILFSAPELLKVVDQCAILKKWDPTFNNATCTF